MKAEWEVRFHGVIMDDEAESHGRIPAPDALERFMDVVGLELDKLDTDNVLIETIIPTGHIDLALTVSAFQFEEAVSVGSSLIRTAFHAAGAATPGWSVDWIEVKAERSPDRPGDLAKGLVDA
jgi:hypothetical protein